VAASAATVLQFLAILLISLLAGSTFGIWRGYNPKSYAGSTFLEVHQGAIRGLNVLLPALGLASLVAVVVLAFLARDRSTIFWLYAGTAVLIAAGGVITRAFNQPINARVMTWKAGALPADWTVVRDTWWHWHVARTLVTFCALALLVAVVLADCRG